MLPYWWRLLCAFVKSISFTSSLLWPFSLPLLPPSTCVLHWYYGASSPCFPVSLYGFTETSLASRVPPALCCLVLLQPVSYLSFRGWRVLVNFFCSVFSFSAFMHALMSSACPISSVLFLALLVVFVYFFFRAGVLITLVGYTWQLSSLFYCQTSFCNLLFCSRLVLIALWCLFSWAASKSLYPVVFSPPSLALVVAFPYLLPSLLLGAPYMCSGSQILPLLVPLSTPLLWSSGFPCCYSIWLPLPLSVVLCVAIPRATSIPSPAIAAIFSPASFPTCENPTSLSLLY